MDSSMSSLFAEFALRSLGSKVLIHLSRHQNDGYGIRLSCVAMRLRAHVRHVNQVLKNLHRALPGESCEATDDAGAVTC